MYADRPPALLSGFAAAFPFVLALPGDGTLSGGGRLEGVVGVARGRVDAAVLLTRAGDAARELAREALSGISGVCVRRDCGSLDPDNGGADLGGLVGDLIAALAALDAVDAAVADRVSGGSGGWWSPSSSPSPSSSASSPWVSWLLYQSTRSTSARLAGASEPSRGRTPDSDVLLGRTCSMP
jgi:hypothetical protein